MKKGVIISVIFTSLLTALFYLPRSNNFNVCAQGTNIGIANTYALTDPDIEDGDIIAITSKEGELKRATDGAEEELFGIYVESPNVVYITDEDLKPILRQGDVSVNITTLGGNIRIGDLIASSKIAGKGQKASSKSVRIVGIALDSFGAGSGSSFQYQGKSYRRGQIRVSLNVVGKSSAEGISVPVTETGATSDADAQNQQLMAQMQNANLVDKFFIVMQMIKNTLTKKNDDSSRLLRYIVAALVAIITTYFSFTFFGKNVTKGIESIGRNPLAKVQIQTMIVLNIVLISIVTIGGVILSLVIIKF